MQLLSEASQSRTSPEELNGSLVFQSGHMREITALALNTDQTLLATSEDYLPMIKIWDMRSRLELRTIRLRTDVSRLKFASANQLVVITKYGELIKINALTGQVYEDLINATPLPDQITPSHLFQPDSPLALSSRGVIAASLKPDSAVREFTVRFWAPLLSPHPAPPMIKLGSAEPHALEFIKEDQLAVSEAPGQLSVYTLSPQEKRCSWHTSDEHSAEVSELSVSDEEQARIAFVYKGKLVLIDANTCRELPSPQLNDNIQNVRWSSEHLLMVTDLQGAISAVRFDAQAGVTTYPIFPSALSAIEPVDHQGKMIIAHHRSLWLWSPLMKEPIRFGPPHTPPPWVIPLGAEALLISTSQSLEHWVSILEDNPLAISLSYKEILDIQPAAKGDQALIVFTDLQDRLCVGLYRSGERGLVWQAQLLDGHRGYNEVKMSPEGDQVLILTRDHKLRYLNATTGLFEREEILNDAKDFVAVSWHGSTAITSVGHSRVVIDRRGDPTPSFPMGLQMPQVSWPDQEHPGYFFVMEYLSQVITTLTQGASLPPSLQIKDGASLTLIAAERADPPHIAVACHEGGQVLYARLGDTSAKRINTNARDLNFAPQGGHLAIVSELGELIIFDVIKREEIKRIRLSDAMLSSVSYRRDGSQLIVSDTAGAIFLLDARTYKLQAQVFIEGASRLIVTPDRYYMGSPLLMNRVAMRVGERVYPFSRFDISLHRPHEVYRALGREGVVVDLYRAARDARLKRLGYDHEPQLFTRSSPTLTLKTPLFNSTLNTSTIELSLEAKAIDERALLERLSVQLNGARLPLKIPTELAGKRAGQGAVEVPLMLGQNIIELEVQDSLGQDSLPARVMIERVGEPKMPSLYVISVGVSDYDHRDLKLQFAAKDALDVSELFEMLEGYQGVYTRTLTDKQVTREAVIELKSWLAQAQPHDTVILFFAGHGVLDQQLRYWYAPVNFDPDQPELSGVSWSQIEELVTSTPSLNRVVILDTCHAGDSSNVEAVSLNSEVKVRELESHRGAIRVDVPQVSNPMGIKDATHAHIKPGGLSRLIDELFLDVRASGMTVIAASSGAEFSYESPRWSNGVFTFALREALDDLRADDNQDGVITLIELRGYLEKRVYQLTGGAQRPVMRRENLHMNQLVLTSKGRR